MLFLVDGPSGQREIEAVIASDAVQKYMELSNIEDGQFMTKLIDTYGVELPNQFWGTRTWNTEKIVKIRISEVL